MAEPVLAAHCEVGFDVVELAEESAEGDVPFIVELGVSEDEDAILVSAVSTIIDGRV